MKRFLSLFICLTMVMSLCSFTAMTAEPDIVGDGLSEATAYEIKTANHFKTYVTEGTTSFFKLTADINLNGSGYVPVTFKGKLDGQNYSITFDYDTTSLTEVKTNTGLFLTLDGATVKNLVLKGSYKGVGNNTSYGTGALAGAIPLGKSATIANVINKANVTAVAFSGGIIGNIVGGTEGTISIKNCVNYGAVSVSKYDILNAAGGMVGLIARNAATTANIEINNCYNYGTITCGDNTAVANTSAGGILGVSWYASSNLKITYCGNYGNVTCGNSRAGGIVGGLVYAHQTPSKPIENCFNIGNVTSLTSGGNIGGICGYLNGASTLQEFKNCFNAGTITAPTSNAYGIAIYGKATNCYNVGKLNAATGHPVIHKSSTGGMTNCYALVKNGENVGTSSEYWTDLVTLKTEDELKASLPTGFDSTNWEFLTISEVTDYYKYPQLKGNHLYYDYKNPVDDTNVYPDEPLKSSVDGSVVGATSLDFGFGKDIYETPQNGYKISRHGTYSGLNGTKIVYTETPFTVSKSAVIYVATEAQYTSNGFSPVLNNDETDSAKLSMVCAKQYKLSKKSVIVNDATPVDVDLTDSLIKVAFIKWADNVLITMTAPANGSVKINNTLVSGSYSENHIKGEKIELTVTPSNNYYLKELKADSTALLENKIEEETVSFYPLANTPLTVTFDLYELNRDLQIVRTTNPDSTIKQELVLSGNATEMLAGKSITFNVNKNSSNVLTQTETIEADGQYEVKIVFTEASDDYDVEAVVDIASGYSISFIIDDNDAGNGNQYNIPSVTSINALITALNGDKTLINRETLINDIKTDTDLNFNVAVFGTSNFQTNIVEAFLAYSDAYTVENIYQRFDNAVIVNTLANTESAEDVKKIVDNYDSYLDIKSNSIYTTEFNALSNKDKVYKNMSKITYSDYASIKNQFILSVVLELMKNVTSYTNIYTVLDNYKSVLGITDRMTTYAGLGTDKQGYASNYIYTYISNIKTKLDLLSELDNAFNYANTYTPPVNPGMGGGSGGGSGGIKTEVEVEKEPPEENKEEEHTQLAYFTDIESVSWAKEAINELHRLGVVNGRESGRFYPNELITRAEFVKIIVDIFDFSTDKIESNFTDVSKNDWYYSYIAQAEFFGIVSGREDNTFAPDDYITRQDMAVIVVRAIYRASKHEALSNKTNITATFTDIGSIAGYAKNSVLILAEDKLVNGYEDGSFLPEKNTTRAEATQLIYNVNKIINK